MLSFFRKKSVDTPTNGTLSPTVSGIVASKSQKGLRDMQNNHQQQPIDKNDLIKHLGYNDAQELKETIFDILKTIKDPEKPATLEDLSVVYEDGVFIQDPTENNVQVIRVEFNPTVPHCSLATLIGLCIRVKIERTIPHTLKLDIYIKKGAHSTEDEINKQINDKERIAAAMENPNLRSLVEECIKEEN